MTVSNLHKIEKKILLTLVKHNKMDIEKLATIANLSLDNVRRGIEWLKYKGIVLVSIQKESIIQPISKAPELTSLDDKSAVTDHLTLPERRIIHEIKKQVKKTPRLANLRNSVKCQILNLVLEYEMLLGTVG